MPAASQKFILLQEVDSTNNYAMGLIQQDGAADGMSIFALRQTAGKGRLGAQWTSNPGENIMLSVITQMQWLPVYQQFHLSVATALACAGFFSQFIKESIKIKWPNDIFLNDSKAGGILIENQLKGNLWQWAVIGVGLNINQESFDNAGFKAISLKQITGIHYDVIALAQQLHHKVSEQISRIKNGFFDDMLDEYNAKLFCAGCKVRLKKGNAVFETIIRKVLPTGELVTEDTIERKFQFDEVKWMGFAGND
ncbi:MAG TPA: biotin--[acetyl-CoA-carboxylase] ligase [Chitinophagaceae bacterium]|nr:biotin--[acetyl-CoA-carboxylase] ligase [Chitinophagaceae bacterium]